jgi:hypothetical protein
MSRNARNSLFDLYCMAYLPAASIPRDKPRRARGEEEFDTPSPANPRQTHRLAAAIVAIAATAAVISAAQLPL